MTVWPRCQEQVVSLVGNTERSDHSWRRVAETPGSGTAGEEEAAVFSGPVMAVGQEA